MNLFLILGWRVYAQAWLDLLSAWGHDSDKGAHDEAE
jgi:hypothetical protein